MRSAALLALIAARPTGVNRGRALAHAQMANRRGLSPAGTDTTAAQRRFIQEMAAGAVVETAGYNHPATAAVAVPRTGKELTAVEMAWLDRLPRDPAQVTWEDARSLAAMASQSLSPADRRLVASVWEPVRHLHDRRAAEVSLANARRPLPEVPASAYNALADAISDEHAELTDGEALSRASAALHEALAERSAARERELQAAQAQLAALDEANAQRVAVVR